MDIVDRLVKQLSTDGLLLQQDAALPNVVAAVAGEPIRGSWWSHAKGQAIYAALGKLARHPDSLLTRLVQGKVTFVHRRLWPAVLAVGQAQAPWQFARLSAPARKLFDDVQRQGVLIASGPTVKLIERRLLVHGEQIHTDAGHHAIRVESWSSWGKRTGAGSHAAGKNAALTPSAGQQALEAALYAVGGSNRMLPWPPASSR